MNMPSPEILVLIVTVSVASGGGLVQIGRWISMVTLTLHRLDQILEDHEVRLRELEDT